MISKKNNQRLPKLLLFLKSPASLQAKILMQVFCDMWVWSGLFLSLPQFPKVENVNPVMYKLFQGFDEDGIELQM